MYVFGKFLALVAVAAVGSYGIHHLVFSSDANKTQKETPSDEVKGASDNQGQVTEKTKSLVTDPKESSETENNPVSTSEGIQNNANPSDISLPQQTSSPASEKMPQNQDSVVSALGTSSD